MNPTMNIIIDRYHIIKLRRNEINGVTQNVLNLAFEEVNVIENEMRLVEKSMINLEGIELERALKKYSDLVQLYEIKGGYEIEEKLSKICTGLHFDEN